MATLHPLPVVLPAAPVIADAAGFPVGSTQFATPGIRNVEPNGVLIDKIVFGFRRPTASGESIAELRWHNQPVTSGFVAVPGITWPQNRGQEAAFNGVNVLPLTRPLYLAPNEYIDVAYRTDLLGTPGASDTFDASAIGRQCAAPPEDRWVPFLCAYLGPIYTINSGGAISDQSTSADLGNPFDTPIFVERLIGRVLVASGAGPTAFRFTDADPSPLWNSFLVRISDHRDNFWVPQPTPLPLVCNAVDRSWILNHTIEPKGFLRAEFEGVLNVADGANVQARAVLGMVGYRRIET